jgi:hypothetical protein
MKLIRKLGAHESYFTKTGDVQLISRLVKIKTPFDINNNIELVQSALRDLKSIHPLLRCSIRQLPMEESLDEKEDYFVELPKNNNDLINNLELWSIDMSKLEQAVRPKRRFNNR